MDHLVELIRMMHWYAKQFAHVQWTELTKMYEENIRMHTYSVTCEGMPYVTSQLNQIAFPFDTFLVTERFSTYFYLSGNISHLISSSICRF